MWMKIIAFVILLAFGGLIISWLADGTGFVYEYFYVPFLFIIPLILVVLIVILYVIYMFVEKGEALRIIANILACVLAVYVVGGVSLLRHSEFMNLYRYKELESSAYQIVNNIFENATIEKDGQFLDPIHQSVGDMLVYESETIRYNIVDESDAFCSVDLYCVDNYILGTNRIIKDFEEDGFFDISNWNAYDDEIVFEDTGNGEIDEIEYKWSYGELVNSYSGGFIDDYNERHLTKGKFMFTYKNSIYVASVSVSSDETIHINMGTEAEKIVEMIKSMHIFSGYK